MLMKDLTETHVKVAWNQAAANFRVISMGCFAFEGSDRSGSAEERKKVDVGVLHIFSGYQPKE